MKDDIFQQLRNALMDGETEKAQKVVKSAMEENIPVQDIVDAIAETLDEVGKKFETGEFFLPDLVVCGDTGKQVINTLAPYLKDSNAKSSGTIVIGTVEGDIHDIGKTLVVTMLTSSGYKVHDLGIDVKASVFVEKAKEYNADIIGASALLSTTKVKMKEIEEALVNAGLKGKVKTMVGGAVVSQKYADSIGADGYCANAAEAPALARKLINK